MLATALILLGSASQWTQVGNGAYADPASTAHHQSGRSQQSALAWDNQQGREVLWVGSSHGGVWKSLVDAGGAITGFVPLGDTLQGSHTLASFLVYPGNSDKLLVATGDIPWGDGDGIYLSSNGGATWTNTLPTQPIHAWRLAEDSAFPDTVLA